MSAPRQAPRATFYLSLATIITLILVPVFYSISVLDLKIIKWEPGGH